MTNRRAPFFSETPPSGSAFASLYERYRIHNVAPLLTAFASADQTLPSGRQIRPRDRNF